MNTHHPRPSFALGNTQELARACRRKFKALLLCGLVSASSAFGQNIWTGGVGDTNWSSLGNWSGGAIPTAGDTVLFDNVFLGFPAATVDNIVDTAFTINSLSYQTTSTNGFHTTLIPGGRSLVIEGSGGNAIFVGTGVQQNNESVYYRIVGSGSLAVTNPTGTITAVQPGANVDHRATLDLSGLTNFSANLDQMLVGAMTFVTTGINRPMGAVLLADTNYIQTAAGTTKPGIMVAAYPGSDTNVRGTQQLFLGWHNIINADVISMGGHKSIGQILFRAGLTGGYAQIRGSAGGADKVKLLTIGDPRARIVDLTGGGTSVASTGTFDTTGNKLDLTVVDLMVARTQTTGAGNSTGTLTLDQGTIEADNLYLGYHTPGTSTAANATGTLNVNGTASVTVNNDLVMANKVGTGTPVGNLNVATNATVNVKGNFVTAGGTSTVTLNGGTINLQPVGDAAPGHATISSLNGGGSILNAANVTNTVLLSPGTAGTAGTLNIGGNLALPASAGVNLNLSSVTTVGGGVNDLVSITGDLTLNSNVLTLIPMATTLASGSYRLLEHTGTRTGFFAFTNVSRYTAALDYAANQVNLLVSGSGGNVRWNGTGSAAWDLTASNWFNTGAAAMDKFLQLDHVLVDDSGAYTNLLRLGTVLFPNTVTVNSSTINYLFGGTGRISGPASLTKSGTGSLTLSNANDFTGNILINAGTLRAANNSALGLTNGTTTIASGATLDLGGASLFNPGEFITVSGSGMGNTGAILNSGADQNNGLRYVSLAGDTTIAASSPGRWDIRGPGGSGTFSGGLFLNGFTLTKIGAGKNSLVDLVITNSGSIVVSNGTLGITRSILDGPGTITGAGTNIIQMENASTGYLAKPLIFVGGGSTFQVVGNAFTLFSPITNAGGLTIDNTVGLTLTNLLTGAGYLAKSGAGNLIVQAAAVHTGPTTISAGTLTLDTNATMTATPSITLGPSAILDVSAVPGGLVLSSGQTLAGSGTVLGDVTVGAGRTIIAGLSAGTLTFSNNLALTSATNVVELGSDPTLVGGGANDLLAVNGNLTLSGVTTLKITPLGPLSDAQPYTVMTYAGGLAGGLANLQVVSDNPRYTFTVVDPATTPGLIQVSVTGVPTTLSWNGGQPGNPTIWNGSVSNWLNGITGDTFFSGDNVQFNDAALTNLVTLAGTQLPGAMTVNNPTRPYTFGGAGGLTGGSLTKQGAAALTYTNSGSVNYSAGVTVHEGAVNVANGSANNFGGTIGVNAGSVAFNNSGVNTFAGGLRLNSGSIQILNPAANVFGAGIQLDGGVLGLNQSVDAVISATISNSVPLTFGSLVKQGGNALLLSGNNAGFDGPIQVNAGVLRAGNAGALGTANEGTTVASGATLDINGQALYNPGDLVTIAGTGLNSTGAVINTGGAQNNALRAITLAADASVGAAVNRWDVRGPGGSGSFSGALNLAGFTLTKLGAGRISVVDANVIDPGSIEVVAGTLAFTRTAVDGIGHINMGANLLLLENYTVGASFTKPLIFNGGILQVVGNAIPITSPITNLTAMTVDAAVTLTAQGTITGPGSLTKIGAGILVLAETNDYSGGTLISAGTLQIGANGSTGNLPPQASGILTNNGTLSFNRADDLVFNDHLTGSGGVQQIGGGTVFVTSSNSYSGQTVLNTSPANSPGGSALRISHGNGLGNTTGNTTINGNSTGNSTLELVNNITVPESFQLGARQGATTDTPHIRNVSGNNSITGNIATTTGGSQYNIESASGRLTMAGSFVPPNTAGTRMLKLMGAGDGEWTGIISNSLDTLVPAVLTKRGAGTWTLAGANVYRGSTTIAEGTLALAATGSISNSPVIDVQTSAIFNVAAVPGGFVLEASQTLMGNGSIVGNVTVLGNVGPGASVGTLTFSNNAVLSGTTIMELDRLATPNADLLVASSLTYGGALIITNTSDPLQAGDTFNLFDWTTRSGSFAAVELPPLDAGLSWDVSNLSVNGTVAVVTSGGIPTTPVPLTLALTGNKLDISWPGDHTGWRLEAQTNALNIGLTGNWSPVSDSTTTNRVIITIDPATGTVFYRLAYTIP